MRRWGVVCGILLGLAEVAGAGEGATVPAAPPEPGRVVARVREVEITYGELQGRIALLEAERGPVPRERYGDVLRGMVREEVLLQSAASEKLDQEASIKARLEQVRRHIVIDELLRRKVAAESRVTDEEIRQTYEKNKGLFSAEAFRISHIMVPTEAEAESLRREAVDGKEFAALARAKSQDAGSAEKGGDLGVLSPGMTEPEFEEAAAALKEGEIGPVIKTQHGYHVIKAGAPEKRVEPLEAVRGRIEEMLGQQKQREVLLNFVNSLETAARPEIFEERLP